MKKFLTLMIIILATLPAVCQFSVGLKAGVSLSNYKVKTKFTEANKGGIAAGITALNTIGKNISIQGDVMYVQKGYNHQICNQCYDKFTSTFIEIPLVLRYSFYLPKISPKLDNFKAHASGGLYLSQWLNAKYETKIFDNNIKQDYSFTGEKRLDFGPNFGVGLEYALFAGSLLLDWRYSLGTVDMSPPESTSSAKNKSMIVSLSYLKSF